MMKDVPTLIYGSGTLSTAAIYTVLLFGSGEKENATLQEITLYSQLVPTVVSLLTTSIECRDISILSSAARYLYERVGQIQSVGGVVTECGWGRYRVQRRLDTITCTPFFAELAQLIDRMLIDRIFYVNF